MKNIKKSISVLSIALAFLFVACSNDDDKNNENDSVNQNEISFNISGAIEGQKKGSCYLVIVGESTYMISSNDGTSSANQTFSLAFHKNFEDNSTANPAPGTYPIDTVANLTNTDGFWIVFTDTVHQVEFTKDVSGTMTITHSDNQLKGTFEFTASNQAGESIQVSNGKFSAAID